MKAAEFKEILKIAVSEIELPSYLSLDNIINLGCDGKRKFMTKAEAAAWVRGECVTFAGQIDYAALADCQKAAKFVDLV